MSLCIFQKCDTNAYACLSVTCHKHSCHMYPKQASTHARQVFACLRNQSLCTLPEFFLEKIQFPDYIFKITCKTHTLIHTHTHACMCAHTLLCMVLPCSLHTWEHQSEILRMVPHKHGKECPTHMVNWPFSSLPLKKRQQGSYLQ